MDSRLMPSCLRQARKSRTSVCMRVKARAISSKYTVSFRHSSRRAFSMSGHWQGCKHKVKIECTAFSMLGHWQGCKVRIECTAFSMSGHWQGCKHKVRIECTAFSMSGHWQGCKYKVRIECTAFSMSGHWQGCKHKVRAECIAFSMSGHWQGCKYSQGRVHSFQHVGALARLQTQGSRVHSSLTLCSQVDVKLTDGWTSE